MKISTLKKTVFCLITVTVLAELCFNTSQTMGQFVSLPRIKSNKPLSLTKQMLLKEIKDLEITKNDPTTRKVYDNVQAGGNNYQQQYKLPTAKQISKTITSIPGNEFQFYDYVKSSNVYNPTDESSLIPCSSVRGILNFLLPCSNKEELVFNSQPGQAKELFEIGGAPASTEGLRTRGNGSDGNGNDGPANSDSSLQEQRAKVDYEYDLVNNDQSAFNKMLYNLEKLLDELSKRKNKSGLILK